MAGTRNSPLDLILKYGLIMILFLEVSACALLPSDPPTRSTDTGVTVQNGTPIFQILLCPDESVESLSLYSVHGDSLTELWRIDKEKVTSVSIYIPGVSPEGFKQAIALNHLTGDEQLFFEVETDRRLRVTPRFVLANLRGGEWLTEKGYRDAEVFNRQARDC
jgi:hypothetical protein